MIVVKLFFMLEFRAFLMHHQRVHVSSGCSSCCRRRRRRLALRSTSPPSFTSVHCTALLVLWSTHPVVPVYNSQDFFKNDRSFAGQLACLTNKLQPYASEFASWIKRRRHRRRAPTAYSKLAKLASSTTTISESVQCARLVQFCSLIMLLAVRAKARELQEKEKKKLSGS